MTEIPSTIEAPASRRVRALDVAREAGVSRAAVGFVINNTPGITISSATREKVLEAAKKLGYRPNVAASALARGKSNIVLLVLPDWPLDQMLGRHLAEAERVLNSAGLHLITSTKHSGSDSRPLWELLAPDIVIGLMPFTEEELTALRNAGIARVYPDREMDATENPAYERGPRLQVEHLIDGGHARIAYVGSGDPYLQTLSDLRHRVAASVAEERGALIAATAIATIDSDLSEQVRSWRANGISAVVAYNDEIAAVVLRAAHDAAVAVPEELAVVGHDDVPLARLVTPALTTIAYDASGLGDLFTQLARDPAVMPDMSKLVTLPNLVVRASG